MNLISKLQETIETNKELIAQYRKEAIDMASGAGLGKGLSRDERHRIGIDLTNHVRDLLAANKELQEEINQIEKDQRTS